MGGFRARARRAVARRPVRGPYSQLRLDDPGDWEPPVLVSAQTSDGSGQLVHPDVCERSAERGEGFLMVATPYPHSDSYFENPELFSSNNGIAWAPATATRPLVSSPGRGIGFNSDPCLCRVGNKWHLYYRRTLRPSSGESNSLHCLISEDGLSWSRPEQVASLARPTALLSPSVREIDGCPTMFTVETPRIGTGSIHRWSSPDGLRWLDEGPMNLRGLPPNRRAWHIAVCDDGSRLHAVLTATTGDRGQHALNYHAVCSRGGTSWEVTGQIAEPAYWFESELQYRGCLMPVAGDPSRFHYWYSAMSRDRIWSIAYRRVELMVGQLGPIGRT